MSKQVMQRALEALEYHVAQTRPIEQTSQAIAELRAAIDAPEVEPVGHFYFDRDDFTYKQAKDKISFPACIKLYTAPPDTEAVRRDAERYRWLCNAKGLELRSDGSNWCKHGEKFIAPFSLAANGTRYGAFSSLDEMIDAAIAAQGGVE